MNKSLYDIFSKWTVKGTIWLYSDPHFGDLELYKVRCPEEFDFTGYEDRPTDEWIVEKLDEEQIKCINSKVGKNDTIIFLGDIGNVECISKIKGYKVLIKGNHDKGNSNYKRKSEQVFHNGFTAETYKSYIDNKCQRVSKLLLKKDYDSLSEEEQYNVRSTILFEYEYDNKNVTYEDNHLFDEIYEGPLMINDRLILSHEPIYPLPEYMYNIHGHCHFNNIVTRDNYKVYLSTNHLNVCAECINYTPVNLTHLLKHGILSNTKSIHTTTVNERNIDE